jgi:hypothetical protein
MFIRSLLLTLVTLFIVAATPIAAQDKQDAPGAEPEKFRPKGFTDKLTPYSLEAEFQENKKKAEAGQAHNIASFLVKEFSVHYYPKAEFQWHRAGSGFRNVGMRKKDDNTVQEVFLSWMNLSDGSEWGFFNGELERTTKADRFAIIADAEVANKIKKTLLDRKLLGDLQEATDVFSYRTRSFSTAQKGSGLTFPAKDFGETRYGVSVGDKVYFFTTKGDETK